MAAQQPQGKPTAADYAGMPAFAGAVRKLAHVPKAEVDAAITKEREQKKPKKRTKRK